MVIAPMYLNSKTKELYKEVTYTGKNISVYLFGGEVTVELWHQYKEGVDFVRQHQFLNLHLVVALKLFSHSRLDFSFVCQAMYVCLLRGVILPREANASLCG